MTLLTTSRSMRWVARATASLLAIGLSIGSGRAVAGSQQWTVPVGGGGGGKLWRVGTIGLPINTQIQGFYNAERPEFASDWQLRVQIQFLFPK